MSRLDALRAWRSHVLEKYGTGEAETRPEVIRLARLILPAVGNRLSEANLEVEPEHWNLLVSCMIEKRPDASKRLAVQNSEEEVSGNHFHPSLRTVFSTSHRRSVPSRTITSDSQRELATMEILLWFAVDIDGPMKESFIQIILSLDSGLQNHMVLVMKEQQDLVSSFPQAVNPPTEPAVADRTTSSATGANEAIAHQSELRDRIKDLEHEAVDMRKRYAKARRHTATDIL